MTKRDFARTQEFINSMFKTNEEATIINSNGKPFHITYQDIDDKPITPIGHFSSKSSDIPVNGIAC